MRSVNNTGQLPTLQGDSLVLLHSNADAAASEAAYRCKGSGCFTEKLTPQNKPATSLESEAPSARTIHNAEQCRSFLQGFGTSRGAAYT